MQEQYNTPTPFVRLRLTDAVGYMIGFIFLPREARIADIEPKLRALGAHHIEVLAG